jgi:hypothetical protein
MNAAFNAAKVRAIQKLEPAPGVLRSATQAATLAQMRQIATRADMNAILDAPNVLGGTPFQKQAAQKIKDEMNAVAVAATGGRRRTAHRRTAHRRTAHRRTAHRRTAHRRSAHRRTFN